MNENIMALLSTLPPCDEYDNGMAWTNGMVLSDALALKNTWFWRTGDPWLGGINELIKELAIPSDWVEWRGDGVALIRIANTCGALTYVQDSRYEGFALAWPNADLERTERSDGTLQGFVRCADCGRDVPRMDATEQTTFEGTKVRCEPCGDAAEDRALRHHGFSTPNTELTSAKASGPTSGSVGEDA